MKVALEEDCSFLKNKFSITRLQYTWPDRNMGVQFEIFFHGVTAALEQFKLVPVPDYMEDAFVGVNVFTEESILRPFGESLIFEVIPADYLYTRET